MITDEDKERVRQATDIVQLVSETVELKQRGREFWGCCPFHHEKTPSFKVDPATGLWHCFGACSEGGDVFKYVMKRENLSFPDSIRYLADRAGIELTEERGSVRRGPRKNRLIECLGEAESFYHTMLMRGKGEGPAAARSYLAGRGFGSDVCKRWNLGYAPGRGALVQHLHEKGFTTQEITTCDLARQRDGRTYDRFYERAMFPIHDELGRTIAFGGRLLTPGKTEHAPKYLNSGDTPVFNKGKHLFAFDRARETMAATGTAIVCEGYTDVISMHEAGFTNAVAALGTAFRIDHIRLIERFATQRIICMFDGDEAGQRAAERAIQFVDKTKDEMLCVVLPDNQDPAEFLAAHGADALKPYLDNARPLVDFVFEKRLASYDLAVPGQRVAALDDVARLLAPLKDSILLDSYAEQLADQLGVTKQEVVRRVRSVKPRPERYQRAEASQAEPQAGEAEAAAVQAPAPARSLHALSHDERMQAVAERELLAIMAADIDKVRPYGDRLASISWSDMRNETMAWAMLATPDGSSPADVVAAAEAAVPGASDVLGAGRLVSQDGLSMQQKVDFLVDVVEYWSDMREVRKIKGRLKSLSQDSDSGESRELFKRATQIQQRLSELNKSLSAVAG